MSGRVHGHLVEGGDDAGVGQRHPLGLLGDRLLVEEAGGEQIGEHAGGYEHAMIRPTMTAVRWPFFTSRG